MRVSSCGLANFLRELGHAMTACLKEDASACIGMATRLGPGRLKHVEIKHFALQHWVTTGTTNSGQGDYDRAVGRHHDKTFFIPDVDNLCSENCFDEMCNRSLNLRIRVNGWAMLARLSSTSMTICDRPFSVENLTSFQCFASGTCRYFFELVVCWMLRELAFKGLCGRV